MKKLLFVLGLFGVFFLLSSFKDKALKKDPFSEARWRVVMVSSEQMNCYNDSNSHCPVYWFLNQK